MTEVELKAKEHFYNKEYKKALKLFIDSDNKYAAGLCNLLLKNEKEAKKFWLQNKKHCPASQFGLIVLDLIKLKTKEQPSFFQTRAQLEIYLNLFLENNLIEWAENLISCCDFLYKANPESYKFIARALYSNGYFDMAITFCKRSLRLFYCDPEAFLILSQCYFLKGDNSEALELINKVLNMVDDYYPAILFKEIIKNKIKENNN